MNWQVKALTEVCEINPRLSRDHGLADDALVSFVPMAAVDEVSGVIRDKQERQLGQVKRGYTAFCDDDVLFAKITPCMENGKAAIASDLLGGVGFGSTEFHVLRPKPGVLPEWIYYFVRREPFRHEAKRNFTGTAGQQRVPTTFLASCRIPVPPIDEQRRIVDLLSRAEGIVRLRHEAQAKAAEIIPALFIDMFGDPATNPKSWDHVAIGQLSSLVTSGSTPRGGAEVYVSEGPYFIRSQNVLMNKLALPDAARIPQTIHEEMSRTKVMTGDVLLNITGASIGRVAWVEALSAEANVNQHVCIIRLNPALAVPAFLSVCLSLPFHQAMINKVQAGASRQALNHQQVRNLKVALPPLSSQRLFSDRLASVASILAQQADALASAEATFRALLFRAFSGDLSTTPRVAEEAAVA